MEAQEAAARASAELRLFEEGAPLCHCPTANPAPLLRVSPLRAAADASPATRSPLALAGERVLRMRLALAVMDLYPDRSLELAKKDVRFLPPRGVAAAAPPRVFEQI